MPPRSRTRTGCVTCRQRKLKCDEQRPVCAQCVKGHRECVPSSGITFRHQQNPSMNGNEQDEGNLKNFYGYKSTFRKETQWVKVPSQLTFVHTNNPYEDGNDGREHEGQSLTRPAENDPRSIMAPTYGTGMSSANDVADFGPGVAPYDNINERLMAGLASVAENAVAENASRYSQDGRSEEYELAQGSYPQYATRGLEALSAVASQDHYNNFDVPPPARTTSIEAGLSRSSTSITSPQLGRTTPATKLMDYIFPSATSTDSNIDPRLHAELTLAADQPAAMPDQSHTPTDVRSSLYNSFSYGRASLRSQGPLRQRRVIIDPERTFLLRKYAEHAGLWMDLFDLRLFFATRVPVLAVECPLLLHSCVALAAKSLARVNGGDPIVRTQIPQQSKMEAWPGPFLDAEGWLRRARESYDVAVSLLRMALAGSLTPRTSSLPERLTPEIRTAIHGAPLPNTDSDELVAAVAILCVYEFCDASGPEWSSHLDGAKTIFDIANDRMVPLTLSPSPISIVQQAAQGLEGLSTPCTEHTPGIRSLSQGRRAVFWNFARQDMQSAFINNTPTRLDTADLLMWRNAGLQFTTQGFICPSNPEHPNYAAECAMQEDMIGNSLVWLLMKLVNFVAAGDTAPGGMSPLGLGVRQRELLEYWELLDEQLRVWYQGLPDSFHATAACPVDSDLAVAEKWFPRPMCASTMQSYHFALLQLLHNKPHMSTGGPSSVRETGLERQYTSPGTSLAARHASYTLILQQSRLHAQEIVAIGLGRSDEASRIHSIQPLWTAGLVLGSSADGAASPETQMWRRTVLRLLRDVERDTGWAASYRVKDLCEVWKWSDEPEVG